MLVPQPERRDNTVWGNRQEPTEVKISKDKDCIEFLWKDMDSEHAGKLDIEFKGIISMSEDGLKYKADSHQFCRGQTGF